MEARVSVGLGLIIIVIVAMILFRGAKRRGTI